MKKHLLFLFCILCCLFCSYIDKKTNSESKISGTRSLGTIDKKNSDDLNPPTKTINALPGTIDQKNPTTTDENSDIPLVFKIYDILSIEGVKLLESNKCTIEIANKSNGNNNTVAVRISDTRLGEEEGARFAKLETTKGKK
jgi:hypothetical protein